MRRLSRTDRVLRAVTLALVFVLASALVVGCDEEASSQAIRVRNCASACAAAGIRTVGVLFCECWPPSGRTGDGGAR